MMATININFTLPEPILIYHDVYVVYTLCFHYSFSGYLDLPLWTYLIPVSEKNTNVGHSNEYYKINQYVS